MLLTLLTLPGQVGQRVLAFETEWNHPFHVQHLHFRSATGIQSKSSCQWVSDLALFTGLATSRNHWPITYINRLCWKTKWNQI